MEFNNPFDVIPGNWAFYSYYNVVSMLNLSTDDVDFHLTRIVLAETNLEPKKEDQKYRLMNKSGTDIRIICQ